MSIDFELVLLWATVIAGIIVLIDALFFARWRKRKAAEASIAAGRTVGSKPHLVIEYARSFFPILLIVFLLRSFLFEPFRIPSSSLEPTLQIGDFILANKYAYGLKIPVYRTILLKVGTPQRGDIVVFRWPPNKHYYFIKRIVGVPGDHVDYIDKTLIINGQQAIQMTEPVIPAVKTVPRENGDPMQVIEKQEDLLGLKHQIYQEPNKAAFNFQNINVPDGMYLVMGDNRDNSADSRYWGFVPEENIVGKASWVWMSWDPFAAYGVHKIRWNRIGKRIQ
jgi:signal peptidase I